MTVAKILTFVKCIAEICGRVITEYCSVLKRNK